jgi:hypothetical protein
LLADLASFVLGRDVNNTPIVVVTVCCALWLTSARAADSAAEQLLEQASLIFRGTVMNAQTSTPAPGEPKVDRATVRVDEVLSLGEAAVSTLGDLKGRTVSVLDSSGVADPLKQGDQWTFYTNGVQYGEAITVEAVGRTKATALAFRTFDANSFADDVVGEKVLPEHVTAAEAVVTGKVLTVRPLPQPKLRALAAVKQNESKPPSEHDPKYREAVIEVADTLKGNIPSKKVVAIFSSSKDVRWYNSPKLVEGEQATFILHKQQVKNEAERNALLTATAAEVSDGQIFTALDPKDIQPVNSEKVKQALEK